MVFSGLPFLFFYLVVTLLIYKLTPLKLRNLVLLIASLFFYGWGEPVYIVIMFLSIAVDYTHGMLVERWRDNDRNQGPAARRHSRLVREPRGERAAAALSGAGGQGGRGAGYTHCSARPGRCAGHGLVRGVRQYL